MPCILEFNVDSMLKRRKLKKQLKMGQGSPPQKNQPLYLVKPVDGGSLLTGLDFAPNLTPK